MYQFNQYVIQSSLFYGLIFSNVAVLDVAIASNTAFYSDHKSNSDALVMIKRAGYPAESHLVTTEDGYILEMHRIPGPVGSIPVFLQHELFGSSNLWLIGGINNSLAYLLANKGYDVWMGNDRGTTYGKAHMNISTEDPQFWKYSQHELGVYDLPAEILYVTNFTSQSVIFIGFSMGSPISFIMTSQRLDIQSKIRLMIHFAPAIYINNARHVLIRSLSPFGKEIKMITDLLGIHEVPPAPHLLRLITKYLCTLNKIQQKFCKEIIMSVLGIDSPQFALSMVPKLLQYAPDSTSTMVLSHYAQWSQSGHFRQYDYGKTKNMGIYNRTAPPDYDVTKVFIPNVIFYGENDWFADPKDVFNLYNQLPIKAGLFRVNYTKFTHLDFRIAVDAPTLLHNHIVTIMNDYK